MTFNRASIKSADQLDILSAIWILSCNDENPLITYESIIYRLNLPHEYDVRGLIQSRGELFRMKVSQVRLEEWKTQMRTGRHLPSWIRDIEDRNTRNERIDGLTIDDVFRNQFRAQTGSSPIPVEAIKWGLEHIDRLRKAGVEDRDERLKRMSSFWIPVLSLLLALFTLVSTAFLQYRSITSQEYLKKYETAVKPKQEGYALFMASVIHSFQSAFRGEIDNTIGSVNKIETAYYLIEPFLSEGRRSSILSQYEQFASLCYMVAKEPDRAAESPKRDQAYKSFLSYKKNFQEQLSEALFGKEASNEAVRPIAQTVGSR
jgi:hypothetical protein